MFDFASKVRQEGDATDINDKGLVNYDRKVKKDAFFYYKTQWSNAPVVHITGRRWRDRTDAKTAIKVYRNAPRVALRSTEPRSTSEEHTSETQSLLRLSYAVFCMK